MKHLMSIGAIGLGIGLVTAGCGVSAAEHAPQETGRAFYQRLSDGDVTGACDLLSPAARTELEAQAGKPCARALPEQELPEVGEADPETARFSSMARLLYPDEVTFLSRYSQGWLVVAAGCTPSRSGVYDCKVEGR
jgi:hypothetical protein